MHKLYGFFRRDVLLSLAYRFQVVLDLLRLGGIVVALFFVSRLFTGGFSSLLSRYGDDYFSYALTGMAVSVLATAGLATLAAEIRKAQSAGTLESLLLTATGPGVILVGSSLWAFLEALGSCLLYMVLAVVLMHLDVAPFRVGLGLVTIGLTFLCFLSLGLVSAAFIMVFKQGNPVQLVFGTASYFFGGVLFPVDVLPAPVAAAATWLPMTQATTALREALLAPETGPLWTTAAVYLAVFSAVGLPLGLAGLRYSLARAKRDGSLVAF